MNTKRGGWYLVLACCLLITPAVLAQPMADTTCPAPGSWALQFGIGQNFTLTSFQGTTIAVEYKLSELRSVRMGVTLGARLGENASLVNETTTNSRSQYGTNTSDDGYAVTVTAQMLWRARIRDGVVFYAGAGPLFSVTRSVTESETIHPPDPVSGFGGSREVLKVSNTQYGAGVAGVAGVEWYAARWVSIHAEYAEVVRYHWGKTSATYLEGSPGYLTTSSSSGSSHGWSVDAQGVTFGLSVFF